MSARGTGRGNRRSPPPSPRPLGPAGLRALALAYVARFATSSGRLEDYLHRKLRERGFEDAGSDDGAGEAAADPGPHVAALVCELVALGYCDNEAYARNKSAGLLARGLGPRRVAEALRHAGIARELSEGMAPDAAGARRAALRLAQKRRLGPYAPHHDDDRAPADPAARARQREKQLAAMLRAGHALDEARTLIDLPSPAAAESWAAELEEKGDDGEPLE